MDDKEMRKIAIEKYINIQRIKKHGQEEIEFNMSHHALSS